MTAKNKMEWSGRIVSVQPRIRLLRSFDQRQHSYLGYVLRIEGICAGEQRRFQIAIGKAAQGKHRFRIGLQVMGKSVPVEDKRLEVAEYYKSSGLKVVAETSESDFAPPPFQGTPPGLDVYAERGHRRLDARTYESKCMSCIWGCRMPVEMIIDQWNPSVRRHRLETFCYGPKSCSLYRAGPTRKVPGRNGMSYTEEDWVDEDYTSHRGMDD